MKKNNKISNTKTRCLSKTFLKNGLILMVLSIFIYSCYQNHHDGNIMLESIAEEYEDQATDEFNTEEYDRIYENQFLETLSNPLSTFSIDVDNASYSNIRRFLNNNQLPPPDAVRIEEMINYFSYDYPNPEGKHPFSIYTEIAECPWETGHRLVHIGLQGKKINYDELKPCNLVFLIDASGSMSDANKLPLVKKSLKLMLEKLNDNDRISIVAYAGAAGLVLPSTSCDKEEDIIKAIENLEAGGSTAGGAGIKLAYDEAKKHIIKNGNNRVVLCTDGDFNVGVSSTGDLVRLIEEKRKDDIYLTICGFGMGNYKDGRMEQISNAGNGNYFYIDNIKEAEKVFVKELRANMFTIAKDVKIQIEFNPTKVYAYRLIGYENRILAKEDFNDDKKDAGELGAGHTVTAIYELVPHGTKTSVRSTDSLKYHKTNYSTSAMSDECMQIKMRYKPINSNESILLKAVVPDSNKSLKKASDDFKFSAAVCSFGMILRNSNFKGKSNFKLVEQLAKNSLGDDKEGYRSEFLTLVDKARLLSK